MVVRGFEGGHGWGSVHRSVGLSTGHVPVLCEETINLVISNVTETRSGAGRVYVDATFGRGGHCLALLARLDPEDRVIAIDRDKAAIAAGDEIAEAEPRLEMVHARFSELTAVLHDRGVDSVDGVIMDLGVSSPQLDEPERGFSFRGAGPIDMRMDQSSGETAGEWLNRADEAEIARVVRTYGEERYAKRIARAIVQARPLATTVALAEVIRDAIPARDRYKGGSDAATRTFQAIRMHVNEELDEVAAGIRAAFGVLAPGGRLAVISFHSLEDRVVKQTFRALSKGRDLPRNLPVRAEEAKPAGRVAAGPVRAGERELAANPRARSATLRVLERLA
ncbi:MAG: 16S rRNA (cytosine(1402)-N(4))-methyltransferase RsmH [Pseudomonadales bacterium]